MPGVLPPSVAAQPRCVTSVNYLLPDSDAIRTRIRSRFATDSADTFDLRAEIGRDCVGAVQLLPEGMGPTVFDRIETEVLSGTEVEQQIAVGLSSGRVLGQGMYPDDLRISIAGAQEKTALLFHRGNWRRPLDATLSTHILKLPPGIVGHLQMDMQSPVENEWLCLHLLRAYGVACALVRDH
ncbi:MAG: HipA domain-containing protein [Opitutaceae bacterium]|jgi:serine/threonine-protein kinase HipA|nr:HipA domain-containing protein [Opitutaceae bacterium]